MMHGLDTGFLVAVELVEHAEHAAARTTLAGLVAAGDRIAIAPQVLAEFIHVVTDSRRFTHPFDPAAARRLAEQWWTAGEVVPVFPDDGATKQFLSWLAQYSLGRKRLLDAPLASDFVGGKRWRNTPWVASACWTPFSPPLTPRPASGPC